MTHAPSDVVTTPTAPKQPSSTEPVAPVDSSTSTVTQPSTRPAAASPSTAAERTTFSSQAASVTSSISTLNPSGMFLQSLALQSTDGKFTKVVKTVQSLVIQKQTRQTMTSLCVTCVCVTGGCDYDEMRCSSGRCIPQDAVCDRQNNCGDWSDEFDCGEATLISGIIPDMAIHSAVIFHHVNFGCFNKFCGV